MRHILIIISFMLLTSPLYGDSHIVKNHFGWITSSGFQLKEFGDNNDHPIYNGEAENGKPNGMGIMSFPDGRKYVGQWKDGKEHGLGALSYVIGERKGEKINRLDKIIRKDKFYVGRGGYPSPIIVPNYL